MTGSNSKGSVSFVLPTADEDNWLRTGRGFRARLAYKEYKKTGKISGINYKVYSEDEIHDLQGFLRAVAVHAIADKGKTILEMYERGGLLRDKNTDEEVIAGLNHLAENLKNDGGDTALAQVHVWYDAAMKDGLYSIQDSKDETDAGAIAEVNKPPAENDQQGDAYMDD